MLTLGVTSRGSREEKHEPGNASRNNAASMLPRLPRRSHGRGAVARVGAVCRLLFVDQPPCHLRKLPGAAILKHHGQGLLGLL